MKEVTAIGSTFEEAVSSALAQMNASREEVEIDVVEEGKKGLFGLFGARNYVIKVTLKKNAKKDTEQFLYDITKKMGLDVKIESKEVDREVIYHLSGKDIALLIGKRGQTLNSIQYLAQLVFNRSTNQYRTIIVDAENYRLRRREALEQLAHRLAYKAAKSKQEVSLEPMPSYERKVIHTVLLKNKEVKTYSAGEEPHRHLVISPIIKK
ncbi:RNA-binding cell elongation regulator Jag/EloR [Bacillus suaedaesalsae]|uniref:RNA-binding protein KhpB n=1 Tax=Bacillus suaedaesalsae TaxID=2810349 RepID=A0ABS2DHB2_9BACI|nr:protein jag [Bacillus suaedaesalsae]